MNKLITASTLSLMLAAQGVAVAATPEQQHAELQELKMQLQVLVNRVDELERQNAALMVGSAAAVSGETGRVAALEQRVAGVEQASGEQADRLAQSVAKDKSMDWASKLKWKGDLRYRHEMIEEEAKADRTRQRIRARIGIEAKVADNLKTYIGIATGDPEDPRSTNTTLGGGNVRKNIALDYAYVDWAAIGNTTFSLGKMKYPFERLGGSLFYDGDVNPEGGAVRYKADNGVFVNAYGFWISESSNGADANVFGAQVGWASDLGLKVAVTYNDYGAIQGNSVGLVDLGGNSTYGGDSSCNGMGTVACYLYDYDILGVGAMYAFKIGRFPAGVWADYLENTAVSDLNRGYNVGFSLGKAGDPGSWEIAALYQDVEKDAQWGGVIDSDFAGGSTQGKGVQLKGAYVPVKNTLINLTLFDNTRDYDTASERDYQRLQLDFSIKF